MTYIYSNDPWVMTNYYNSPYHKNDISVIVKTMKVPKVGLFWLMKCDCFSQ